MIKLTQLIKELDINKPIPKFRNDNELMKYLNSNIGGIKDEFINLVANEMNIINDPEWDYVIRGWKQNDIENGDYEDNEMDNELILDDGEDDRIHFTLNNQLKGFYEMIDEESEIQLGPNLIYFKYY